MAVANWGRFLCLTTLLYCLPRGYSLWVYLLLSLLLGACGALFTPARAAFLRRLLAGEDLLEAAALEGTVGFLLRLIAPAVIGVVMVLSSARLGIFVDSLFYLGSIAALWPRWVTGPWVGAESRDVLGDLVGGWRAIVASETLRRLLMLDFLTSLIGMAAWSTTAAFLETVAHVGAVNTGWLQASMGFSGALGTRLMAGRAATPWRVAWLLAGIAGTYVLLAQATTLGGIVGVWFLRGLVIGSLVVLIAQEMAAHVPAQVMGRVQSAWDQVACLACFAGSMSTPWLLRHCGAQGSFQLFAAVMVAFVVVWWGRLLRAR
ncbi:unnamed protein product [Phaeothamnion confervicola]